MSGTGEAASKKNTSRSNNAPKEAGFSSCTVEKVSSDDFPDYVEALIQTFPLKSTERASLSQQIRKMPTDPITVERAWDDGSQWVSVIAMLRVQRVSAKEVVVAHSCNSRKFQREQEAKADLQNLKNATKSKFETTGQMEIQAKTTGKTEIQAKRTVPECGKKLMIDISSFTGGRQVWLDVTELADAVRSDRMWLLLLCLLLDFIGIMSYFLFLIGEIVDIWWAPIFGFILHYLFGSVVISSLGVIEELLPFTDILPTATLAWCITYLNSFAFLRSMLGLSRHDMTSAVESKRA